LSELGVRWGIELIFKGIVEKKLEQRKREKKDTKQF
jgi:hypothetical protein